MNRRMILYLLGNVLMILAAFMLLPILTGIYYGESGYRAFLPVMVGCLVGGFLITRFPPKKRVMYAKDGFVMVALCWVLISLVGALPFTISGQIPNYIDAIFETVSGFTTTGASILTRVEDLDHSMLIWRSFTHWLGGMGVLVFMLAIVPFAGGESIYLLRAESPGPVVSKMVPKMRNSSILLYSIYIGMTLLQILLYWLGDMPWFDNLCLTFGTAGTGGFSIRSTGLSGYSSYLQTVTTVFMLLFSVNFSMYFLLLQKRIREVARNSELRCFLGIVFTAIALITINVYRAGNYFASVGQTVHHAAFSVASVISTTGYGTADFSAWPAFSRTVLACLMLCGACAGSTGGGMKVSRIIILVKSAFAEVRKLLRPNTVTVMHMDGQRVERETVHGVQSFFVIYFGLIVLSVLMVSLDNFDTESTLTAVLSCVNNIGPGTSALVGPYGSFAPLSALSKIVLSLDMLFGRLEIFPMLILMMPSTWRKR